VEIIFISKIPLLVSKWISLKEEYNSSRIFHWLFRWYKLHLKLCFYLIIIQPLIVNFENTNSWLFLLLFPFVYFYYFVAVAFLKNIHSVVAELLNNVNSIFELENKYLKVCQKKESIICINYLLFNWIVQFSVCILTSKLRKKSES